jgi:hypothetical protein
MNLMAMITPERVERTERREEPKETGYRYCPAQCGLVAHGVKDGWGVARLLKKRVEWGTQAIPPRRCPICGAAPLKR